MTVYDSSYTRIGSYKRPRQKTGYEYELQECASAIKSGWKETPKMTHAQTLSILHMTDHIRRRTGIIFDSEEKPAIAQKAASASEETQKADAGREPEQEQTVGSTRKDQAAESVQPQQPEVQQIPAAEEMTDVHVPVTEAFLHPDSLGADESEKKGTEKSSTSSENE